MSQQNQQSQPSISEQLKPLLDIQSIDLKLRDLRERRAVWPRKIEQIEARRSELEAQRNSVIQRRNEQRLERDRLELEMREETDRINQYERRIREIKNNREYQALLREVGVSKKARSDAEDAALRIMQEIEVLEAEIAELTERIGGIEAELSEVNQGFAAARGEIDAQIEALENERATLVKSVSQPLLQRYLLVQRRHKDVIVPASSEGACSGCHRLLPPQLYNQILRNSQLITCPACHRILYAVPQTADETAAK